MLNHPAQGEIIWNTKIVHADDISEKTGVPTDQLYLMNTEYEEDTLTKLIREEEEMQDANTIERKTGVTFTMGGMNALTKYFPENNADVTVFERSGANGEVTKTDVENFIARRDEHKGGQEVQHNPSEPVVGSTLTLTQELMDMLDEDLQRLYTGAVRAACWVATYLKEGNEFDYIPDPEETRNAFAQAINGPDMYGYNRELYPDRDSSRKSLSGAQWNRLTGCCETVVRNVERINILQDSGFKVHNSFEAEYDAIHAERLEKTRQRHDQERLRAERNAAAHREASTQAKAMLKGLV